MARKRSSATAWERLQAKITKRKLEDQYQCPIWITADNELVPLLIMSDKHLKNIHDILTARLDVNWTFLITVQNKEELDYYLLHETLSAYNQYSFDWKWYNALRAEADNRKLALCAFRFYPHLYPREWCPGYQTEF